MRALEMVRGSPTALGRPDISGGTGYLLWWVNQGIRLCGTWLSQDRLGQP